MTESKIKKSNNMSLSTKDKKNTKSNNIVDSKKIQTKKKTKLNNIVDLKEEIILEKNVVIESSDKVIAEEFDSKIIFSKYNPFVFGDIKTFYSNKRNKMIYNLAKFFIVILISIMAILSLYFSSTWQAELINGVVADKKDIFTKLFAMNLNDFVIKSPNIYGFLSDAELKQMLNMNIFNIKNTIFNYDMLQSIVAFGFISIFFIIPILAFKNGSLLSVISMTIGFISITIVFALFIIGLSSYFPILTITKELNIKFKEYTSTTTPSIEMANAIKLLGEQLKSFFI